MGIFSKIGEAAAEKAVAMAVDEAKKTNEAYKRWYDTYSSYSDDKLKDEYEGYKSGLIKTSGPSDIARKRAFNKVLKARGIKETEV